MSGSSSCCSAAPAPARAPPRNGSPKPGGGCCSSPRPRRWTRTWPAASPPTASAGRARGITLEEPLDPAGRAAPILSPYDTVVLDCLTLWVSNLLLRHEDDPAAEELILDAAGGLLALIERSTATWIVISNEVGLGVVPPSRSAARTATRSAA